MLERVYREQLDAVIFSVNQYAGDVFDFYVNQIDYQWRQSKETSLVDSTFLQQNLAIEAIAVQQGNENRLINIGTGIPLSDQELAGIFDASTEVRDRLIRYKETGYIKPETLPLPTSAGPNLTAKLVIIGEKTPCIIFFNPVLFVEDLLAPKIQQIADQELNISLERTNPVSTVYANTPQHSSIVQTKALSILNNYQISVSLQSQSVADFIMFRTQQSIVSLSLLVVMILIGVILVVRNFKREMQLSKAKADFVANVSHEIRTPLSLISMFNETLLLDRVKDEKKKHEYYEIISKETARLKNIVNKILSFSQIDANKKQYNFELLDPNEIVNEVLDTYSYHLNENGFSYQLRLNGTTKLHADRQSLIEVIINLIDNAIKYSRDQKEVTITSQVKSDMYVLSVADHGIGIDKKDQGKVFEKFYRAEGGDIHTTKGTGLGLSLVHQIMSAHGGSISLKSKTNEGSTFTLKFPLVHE